MTFPKGEDFIIVKKSGEKFELSEKRLRELVAQFLEMMKDDAWDDKDFGKASKFVELAIKTKTAFWPATQKSITGELKNFDKQLEQWMEVQEKLLEKSKQSEEEEEPDEIHKLAIENVITT